MNRAPNMAARPTPTPIPALAPIERPPFLVFNGYFSVYTWLVTTTLTGARLRKFASVRLRGPATLGAAKGVDSVETHGI